MYRPNSRGYQPTLFMSLKRSAQSGLPAGCCLQKRMRFQLVYTKVGQDYYWVCQTFSEAAGFSQNSRGIFRDQSEFLSKRTNPRKVHEQHRSIQILWCRSACYSKSKNPQSLNERSANIVSSSSSSSNGHSVLIPSPSH